MAQPEVTSGEKLIEIAAVAVSVVHDSDLFRPVEVKSVIGSYAKLEKDTGWQPQIDLEQSLRDVYEEWLQRLSG